MSMDETSETANAASSVVNSLKETGRSAFADVRSRAADAASRAGEAARAEAMDRAETAKDAVATEGERLASTLRSAVGGGDDSIQARVMGAVADSVDDLTTSLRNRSFADLLDDAQAFAQRNPGAFVAAAALAGFALARFARASTPQGGRGAYDPTVPAVSQGYVTMPSASPSRGYGSDEGASYASSSVSTHGMTTRDAAGADEDDLDGAPVGGTDLGRSNA